jgi:hypothetical protein
MRAWFSGAWHVARYFADRMSDQDNDAARVEYVYPWPEDKVSFTVRDTGDGTIYTVTVERTGQGAPGYLEPGEE